MTEAEDLVFELPFDAAGQNAQVRKAQALRNQMMGWSTRLTSDDAKNLSTVLMRNPTMTPDVAALVVANSLDSDDPLIADLARRDLELQEQTGAWQWVKGAARYGFAGLESLWEASYPSAGRTATRIAQGENPITAWKKSNTSYLAAMAREHRLGNPINIGDGIFPNSVQPEDQPGYWKDVKYGYQQTSDLNASMEAASARAVEKYGTPITSNVHDFANSTLVNKTHDGVTYSTPYSAGRALAIQVTKPETVAFQTMSTLVDGSMRIGLDPSNPIFFDLTKMALSRRGIVPDLDTSVARRIRELRAERFGIRHMDDPDAAAPAVAETFQTEPGRPRDVRLYEDAIDREWESLQRRARNNPDEPFYKGAADRTPQQGGVDLDRFGERTFDEINPYSQHNPDLTVGEVVDEFNTQGGRRAFEDYVLEHELVHSDESKKLLDLSDQVERQVHEVRLSEAGAQFDDAVETMTKNADRTGPNPEYFDADVAAFHAAEDELLMAQAEFHEFVTPIIRQLEGKAEGIAMGRMFDPEYTMQAVGIRADLYRKAGIRHTYRPWLRTNQASDWLQSRMAKPVLEWLAREGRVAQIHNRFPKLPFHTKRVLAETSKPADIAAILKPYLGMEISKTPRLGLARFSDYIQFNPAMPHMGAATHQFSSGYLYKAAEMAKLEGRRLTAVSSPIILSPYRPNQTLDSALQWLRTIRATDQEIESVIRMIGEAAGSNSYNAMVDTYGRMVGILESKLLTAEGAKKGGLGYSVDDVANVLDQMQFDHVANRAYWYNYARNPLSRFDDTYKEILVGVGQERSIRQLSAATEAQFSDSWIGMPNLRDTRRLTSTLRAERERMLYGFGTNNGHFWNKQGLRAGLRPGFGLAVMDKTNSIWRNWMLLRFGWPVRVVGEEMLRAHAYGYGHWLSHPVDIIGQMVNTKAKIGLLGDSLDDIIKLDGLGAGGWKEGDQVYDMSRVAWTPAAVGEVGYDSGLLSELIQLRASRLNKIVAEHGPEEAFRIINADPTLQKLVTAISEKAGKGSTLHKMATSQDVLRRHLQSVDAMIQQAGGGAWIERTVAKAKLRDGTEYFVWRDMQEQPLTVFSALTKRELVEIAKQNGIPVGRQTQRQLANTISKELRGFDDIPNLEASRQFLTIEEGHENVRKLILDGTWGDETVLWGDMTVSEVKALEGRIAGMYDDVGATKPAVVRTAVKTSRDEQQMNTVVDRMFEVLMQKPSTLLARSPHFVTRYTEEVARMYLTSDVRTRALIEGWVVETGFERAWKRALQRMLDEHGLKSVPGGQLDAAALAEGKIRYVSMIDEVPVDAAAIRTQALREGADELGIPNDVAIIESPLDELVIPDAYPASSGPDLRKATLDDLLESYANEIEYQQKWVDIDGVYGDPRGVWGGQSEGVVNTEHHRREISRRLANGDVSSDDVLAAARRLDKEWTGDVGIMQALDQDGMLAYRRANETEEWVSQQLAAQGIEYEPEMFYFHGSEKRHTRTLFEPEGDMFSQGGLTTDFETATGYGDYIYVYHRDQFGPEVSQWPRVERAGTVDEFDTYQALHRYNYDEPPMYEGFESYMDKPGEPGTMRLVHDEPYHIVEGGVEPVAVIRKSDLRTEMARRRGVAEHAVHYVNGEWVANAPIGFSKTEVLEVLDAELRHLFDELMEISEPLPIGTVAADPIMALRASYVEDIRNGVISLDDFQEALGRLMADLEFDDPGVADALIQMNVKLSGMADDAVAPPVGAVVPKVERGAFVDEFTKVQDEVIAAEKVSDPATWTRAQREAYDAGEWEDFSRLRGYTDDEIDQYRRYQEAIGDARAEDVQRPDGWIDPEALYDTRYGEARQVPDAMPLTATGTSRPGGKPGPNTVVPATSPWSNRAIGVLTEDQQLLSRIDEIAKANAIDDTKALFYDLTRRANFTDMARYIFPFGDAFLEQIRIWARAMTPIGEQTGQALQNWRRLQIGVTNARKSGWFSEDEYGNEVMNWPGAGLLATGLGQQAGGLPTNTGMSATIRPDQLLMMNLTPRGGLIPGTGPFIQFPASAMQPLLDRAPPLRDLINWFAFGEYGPGSMSSLDEALNAIAPTTVRRLADAIIPERHRQVYADIMGLTVETLIESGDPRYGDSEETKEDTMRTAQSLGTALGLFRIADGFFSPAQPRYEPELFIDVAGQDPFWMSIAALSDEYRAAREFFKDEKEAIDYMRNRFGVDPLTLIGSTREVQPRPVTKDAYDQAQQNREVYSEMPNSMVMWLPHDDLDAFYLPAHQTTLRDGDRQRLTTEQAMGLRQRQKGWVALDSIQNLYDTMAVKIDREFNSDHRNPDWSEAMTELDRWRNFQRNDVYVMYPPTEPNAKNIEGLREHPTYHDTLYEVVRVGTPGTTENDIIREWQPDMAWWVEEFTEIWDSMEEGSMLFSPDAITKDWWLTSTSVQAQALRESTGNRLNRMMNEAVARVRDPDRKLQLKTQISWFMQRVLEPLFDGYSLNDQMFLQSETTPPLFLSQEGVPIYMDEQSLSGVK